MKIYNIDHSQILFINYSKPSASINRLHTLITVEYIIDCLHYSMPSTSFANVPDTIMVD